MTSRLPQRRKIRIHTENNFICVYCGEPGTLTPFLPESLTIDHKIPKSKGGKDREDNLVSAHQKCNLEKGDMDYEEFKALCDTRKNK